jgi:hypothetical protein
MKKGEEFEWQVLKERKREICGKKRSKKGDRGRGERS